MLLLLALAAALTSAAQRVIENPDIDYVPTWITLTEITLGNDRTVVKAELRNNPNPWVKVSSDTDLIDPATGNKYHILGAEGIELDKKTYMPASGKMLCTLLFETVPASVERLNMVKEGNRSDNNIYGIHLVKQIQKAPAIGEDGIDPWTMTAEYYMSLPPSGAEVNIDYRRHRGMEFCKSATAGFDKPECEIVQVETDGRNLQHVEVLNRFAAAILRGEALVANGREGINGLTLSNAMHLSSWLDKTVDLPFDEDLYLAELNKRRATSRAKEDKGITLNTEGSY